MMGQVDTAMDIDQVDIPMDVDPPSSSPFTSTKVFPPLFNFPQDGSRSFTIKALIAILRYCKANFIPGKPKPSVKKPKATSEAFKILSGELESERKRVILRFWPRKPDGEYITPYNSLAGKTTPNGIQLWGATLFDFYRVNRIPGLHSLSTISTGSKLMRWMKAHGELDYAKDEIEWAEMEEDPKVILPWSPCMKIEELEGLIREGKAGKLLEQTRAQVGKKKKVSSGSPFEPTTYYSSSWPLTPFEYETQRLTAPIDCDRLPKTLMVHDPWNLLAVQSKNKVGSVASKARDTWESKKDRVHVYKLDLSRAGSERLKGDAEKRAKYKESGVELDKAMDAPVTASTGDLSSPEGHLIRPPEIPGPVAPPVFVVHPPPPKPRAELPKLEPIEEAHLYLSPAHPIGSGNHSEVYSAEWEVPRAAILPPPSTNYILCDTCVAADIARIIREEDGEDGEDMDPKWRMESGEVRIVPVGRSGVIFHCVTRDNLDEEEGTFESEDTATYNAEYIGPVRPICTTVEWQDPMHPTCSHIQPPPEVPPTTKMRVVAKMSHKGDEHLENEADNYEKFERHMFQNWSGYNVLPPMHDPVPVGALVPQYYGYYVAEQDMYEEESEEETVNREEREDDQSLRPKKKHEHKGYLSPLLLMEDCGKSIRPSQLTHDQKQEVLALIYRFHYAGWMHGSIFERNILVQPGPLDVAPSERSMKDASFRLIDFGRSYYAAPDGKNLGRWKSDRYTEERMVRELLGTGFPF